jgi:hypothetical protein
MIEAIEAVLQDQLRVALDANGNPISGRVQVHYPRGAATLLAVYFTETPVRLEPVAPDQVSGFTNFTIVGGNLVMTPDRGNAPGYVILGAGLTPLA